MKKKRLICSKKVLKMKKSIRKYKAVYDKQKLKAPKLFFFFSKSANFSRRAAYVSLPVFSIKVKVLFWKLSF